MRALYKEQISIVSSGMGGLDLKLKIVMNCNTSLSGALNVIHLQELDKTLLIQEDDRPLGSALENASIFSLCSGSY